MRGIRQSIQNDQFPQFVQNFFETMFPEKNYPSWAVDALASVNIHLT